MSSISVLELQNILENVPEDYEVIMEVRTKYDVKAGKSISYINGVRVEDEYRSVYLMN